MPRDQIVQELSDIIAKQVHGNVLTAAHPVLGSRMRRAAEDVVDYFDEKMKQVEQNVADEPEPDITKAKDQGTLVTLREIRDELVDSFMLDAYKRRQYRSALNAALWAVSNDNADTEPATDRKTDGSEPLAPVVWNSKARTSLKDFVGWAALRMSGNDVIDYAAFNDETSALRFAMLQADPRDWSVRRLRSGKPISVVIEEDRAIGAGRRQHDDDDDDLS